MNDQKRLFQFAFEDFPDPGNSGWLLVCDLCGWKAVAGGDHDLPYLIDLHTRMVRTCT